MLFSLPSVRNKNIWLFVNKTAFYQVKDKDSFLNTHIVHPQTKRGQMYVYRMVPATTVANSTNWNNSVLAQVVSNIWSKLNHK